MDWTYEIAVERDNVRELAQFDARRAYLYVAGGVAVLLAIPAPPLAVLYANAFMAHSAAAQFALGALLLITGVTSSMIWRKRLWTRPVRARLERWHAADPREGEVAVNIAQADLPVAYRAIRGAQLLPSYTRLEPSYSPPGLRIAVVRSSLAPPLNFDGVAELTREALARAGIGACVNGIDVLGGPHGRVAEHAG